MENWEEKDNKLYREFKFKNFLDAILFMQKAAIEIDKTDHHPEWKNVYNRLQVWLCTHSAGNIITEKDRKLAEILNRIFSEFK